MQALKSLFSRAQVQAAASAQQPVELSAESLKLVGGGLPRVSEPASAIIGGDDASADATTQLPRVS
jgi:hypothetical protein